MWWTQILRKSKERNNRIADKIRLKEYGHACNSVFADILQPFYFPPSLHNLLAFIEKKEI
jgi:hypothetical protein